MFNLYPQRSYQQRSEHVYEIEVETKPGLALLEATTIYSIFKDSFAVNTDEVSRGNQYGFTSKCIVDEYPHLAKFCYCKRQVTSD